MKTLPIIAATFLSISGPGSVQTKDKSYKFALDFDKYIL